MRRTRAYAVVVASIACLFAPTLASAASAAPTSVSGSTATLLTELDSLLTPGQQLTAGQSLQSPNRRFRLTLQDDSLSVLKTPTRLTSESYEQDGIFRSGTSGDRLVMQTDGNLVFYQGNRAVDSTRTNGRSAAGLAMQDDGNVVLYATDGRVLANFATYAKDLLSEGGTLLSGERLLLSDGGTVLVMQGDGNLVLSANDRAVFNTGTQGNPGAAAVQQSDGNFVVYGLNGTPLFDTGTSDDLGEYNYILLGPSDLRVVQAPGDAAFSLYGTSWGKATVLPGQDMVAGDRRTAPGGLFILQNDGNLVQYVNGRPVFVRNDVYAAGMLTDGNFVAMSLTLGRTNPFPTVFTTRTAGNPGSRLVVQGDGNLVVYTPQDRAVYSRK